MTEAAARATRAVLYRRVSTAGQVADGYGLDVQARACRAAARGAGLRIVQTCDDLAVSGALAPQDRPGLACALDALAEGRADILLVARLDRLARELTVQEAALAAVWRMGGRVWTADGGEVLADDPDDPMRTAMRQVVGVFAQLDRSNITKRLRDGRRAKLAAGGYAGGAPRLGLRAEGRQLVPEPAEAAVIARVRSLAAEGLPVRAIADRLNAENVPTKRGGRWHATTVARLLRPQARDADTAREARYRSRDERLAGARVARL